ncbi:Phage integrase, N-terminal SAM-like domain [Pseudomonas sp. NFACC04-2]|nr:Phage integrase, N-terminal SAM-like domain [Pseudomonas sp. NFACC04-2]
MAKQWLAFKSTELVTKSISGFSGALNNHILPAIGNKPVSEIKLEDITTIITELRRKRIMAMARRVRTITAMRLLVMLPVRPGELVQMRWEDVDLVGECPSFNDGFSLIAFLQPCSVDFVHAWLWFFFSSRE